MKEKDIRFHHVYFTYDVDYYLAAISDLAKLPNVDIVTSPSLGRRFTHLKELIYRIHFHKRINNIIKLPLKSLWNKSFYKKTNDGSFYCFYFQMGWLTENYESLFRYLKEKYPYSCFILSFEDIISSRISFPFDLLKKYFDFSITFDKGDAEKYGFYYSEANMSKVEIEDDSSIPSSDFCFIGAAKNRYQLICDLYHYLKAAGARVDFMVSRLRDDQKEIEGIKYIPYLISYKEYLQHVNKTKCIIELLQDGGEGCTSRTIEALIYGKKLLTNNATVKDTSFYNSNQFFLFSNLADISISEILSSENIRPVADNRFSPIYSQKIIEEIIKRDFKNLLSRE